MINAVRTLLLNLDPAAAAGVAAPEYVDPAYRPAELGGPLGRVRAALFGPDPAAAWLGWRLRQFVALLHAGRETEADVLAFDPRVTYVLGPEGLDAAARAGLPAPDLPAVLEACLGLDDEALFALFGGGAAEPYRSWRAMFQARTGPLTHRLGGVLLALAARTADRRGG